MTDQAVVTGKLERVTFANEDTGYRILKVRLPPGQKLHPEMGRVTTITVVGTMPALAPQQEAEFKGKWSHHSKFGWQLQAAVTTPKEPTTVNGIANYLGSGIVKGIGTATAQKVVGYFGDKTLQVLDNDPARLHEVPGLRSELATSLAAAWGERRAQNEALVFLHGLGITSGIAGRIFQHYGAATIDKVSENPYQLAQSVHLIGFRRADDIAINMGIPRDSQYRLAAGLNYALRELSHQGHTCATREGLLEKAKELLGVGGSKLERALDTQLDAEELCLDRLPLHDELDLDTIYLPALYTAEKGCTRLLHGIASTYSNMQAHHGGDSDGQSELWGRLRDIMRGAVVTLTDVQAGAVRAAFGNKVSVITGCPGTGKTTCLLQMISLLDSYGYSYMLASPTGRAAKRMAESTGKEASTIHRLLGWDITTGSWAHNEQNPLPADVIVIDECSMLDLRLFHALLQAVKPSSHLVLVGDIDQLPSVGAGNVLRDVINSGIAHVSRLDSIFRQSERSHIVSNAYAINKGAAPRMDNRSDDFFFIQQPDPVHCRGIVLDVVARRLPAKYGFDPIRDIQVMAPMYKGEAGVNAFNQALQTELNDDPRLAFAKVGRQTYRINDKVMQTRNSYKKGVFNGDIGFVSAIDKGNRTMDVTIDGKAITYDFGDAMDELVLAYCVSIHKSQGSEYPVVVMPLLTQHYMMLQRNLLYTAITRAKQMVVIVGTAKAVHIAVNNNQVAQRFSGLLPRLKSALQVPA